MTERAHPTAADFLATQRGGGLYSETVSQRLGARLAVLAHRRGWAPTGLTIANLVLGVMGSALVVVCAGPAAAGDIPIWAVGLAATALWQLAYGLDCADGQLARVTGRASPAGARVDILCDVVVQISLVTALASLAYAYQPALPDWLGPLFAGTWMVNLITSVLAGGPAAASLVASVALPVRVAKLVRDYGAVVLVAGAVITLAPRWSGWLLAAFIVTNGSFLLASTVQAARSSLRT